jgi:hypothetical protein
METMGNSPTAIGWRVFQPSDAPTQYADLPSLHHSITPSLDPSPLAFGQLWRPLTCPIRPLAEKRREYRVRERLSKRETFNGTRSRTGHRRCISCEAGTQPPALRGRCHLVQRQIMNFARKPKRSARSTRRSVFSALPIGRKTVYNPKSQPRRLPVSTRYWN